MGHLVFLDPSHRRHSVGSTHQVSTKEKKEMKRVSSPEDVPTGHHYAVIVYKSQSVYIPGDERSRTNPGHGYPERTESFDTFEHWVTESKDDWIDFVKKIEIRYNSRHCYTRDPYVFFEVTGRGVLETEVRIKIQ